MHGDLTGWVSCNEQYAKSGLLLCPARQHRLGLQVSITKGG